MTRVLIIKMWAIGDILMATPMLNAIRAKEPDAHITWIVDICHADVLANHPLIDNLIALDSGQWRRLLRKGNVPAWIKRTRDLRAQMNSGHYDVVINCHAEKWWTYFLCAAPATVAVFPSPTLPALHWLYSHSIPKPKAIGLHTTDHFLQATQIAGFPPASKCMTVGKTDDELPFAEGFRHTHGLVSYRPTVVIAPFSTASNRTFDLAFTARIAQWLEDDFDAQVVITCGPGNGKQAREIASNVKNNALVVADGTTVRQYIALLRQADLVICPDSSAMHLAAALNRPYVALFGPTPVNERAPLGGAGRGIILVKPIPCAPCDLPTCSNKVIHQCMRLIEVRDVQAAVGRLLPRTAR
jgi:ADP-heptose:LPS heptosyltransferase